jgi:hypothetical protein
MGAKSTSGASTVAGAPTSGPVFEPVGFVDVLGCVDWPLLVAA